MGFGVCELVGFVVFGFGIEELVGVFVGEGVGISWFRVDVCVWDVNGR